VRLGSLLAAWPGWPVGGLLGSAGLLAVGLAARPVAAPDGSPYKGEGGGG